MSAAYCFCPIRCGLPRARDHDAMLLLVWSIWDGAVAFCSPFGRVKPCAARRRHARPAVAREVGSCAMVTRTGQEITGFNGDGFADVLWQTLNSSVVLWEMAGA